MTKNDLINNVVYDMQGELDESGQDKLKMILTYRLKGWNIVEDETLPSTEVKDNDWIIQRYIIDLAAMGRSKQTITQYAYIVRKFFNDTGLNYTTMTGQDVMDYLALRMYRDHISKSTAATLQRYMSAFAVWAYRKHHIDEDISRDIDRLKTPQAQKKRIPDYNVAKIRAGITDTKKRALFELMLSAGPRVTEICKLKVENLDFTKGEIHIYGEKSEKWRTCFMTEACKVALQDYVGDRTEGYLFKGDKNHKSENPLHKNTIEKMVKAIAIQGGYMERVTVHTYRKTFASREYNRTKDVLYVSKRLGHATTAITIKYYICDDIESDRITAVGAA
ncbi:tyrosine-type recombinase/integrase [Agathobacter rectalis]|uniref:tyrosine-type recombinase/integrase n=1 Tax=Agathobacter rectalis TaxID=39491 RepID=UPI0034A0D18D